MPLPLVSTSTTRSTMSSPLMLTTRIVIIIIGIAFLLLLLSLSPSSSSSSSPSFGVSSFVMIIPPPRSARIRTGTGSSPLFVSSNENNSNNDNVENKGGEEESEEDFQRRMAIVRSLQMSFYGSSAVKPTPKTESIDDKDSSQDTSTIVDHVDGVPEYNLDTGSIEKLSLFRAAWHELPGRSNVLIIRDPIYTNMFERLFYTHTYSKNKKSPWMMFGHLYMPKKYFDTKKAKTSSSKTKETTTTTSNGDSDSSSSKKQQQQQKNDNEYEKYKLSTWNETNYNKRTDVSSDSAVVALSSTAVLGTLMYVRDYRRLKDGRILVLVHASERFVIDQIHQEIPYSIVDAKLLPDIEELHYEVAKDNGSDDNDDEQMLLLDRIINQDESLQARPARNKAIQESIQKYHEYECNPNQKLDGIPSKSDLSIADITHEAISSVLPYCPFNNAFNFDDNNDNNDINNTQSITTSNAAAAAAATATTVTEEDETTPSLELQLLLKGIMKIPPSDKRFNYGSNADNGSTTALWTTDELEFELWKIVDEFLTVTNKTNTVSPLLLELRTKEKGYSNYPNHRRQRRFSYSVAYLLESILPIGITTTSTSTSTGNTGSAASSNNKSNLNEGRYSDNFRNGGRRYSSSSNNKATTKISSSSTSTTKGNNDGNNIDHDSYSDYLMDINEIQQFRSILLSIPSTRQRLRFVLETFYQWRFYL